MPYPIIEKSQNPMNISAEHIAIVIILAEGLDRSYYKVALDSVECYAKAHGYDFILITDKNCGCDHLKDKFFRRHCVVSKILPMYEAVLHLDADIGVVNPKKKLEDFLDEEIDITFYNRHFSPEIATGSYFARRTNYSLKLIEDFSNYEKKLPEGFHGSDNGAIHIFLAEKLFPYNTIELELCRRAWANSKNVIDQLTYTACATSILGSTTDFGKVRILRKGTGYIRDDWLTSGVWNPERDFMLHGWKTNQMAEVPKSYISPVPMSNSQWYNPFLGDFDMKRCVFGNTTWNHNTKLIATRKAVERELRRYEVNAAMKRIELMSGIYDLMKNSHFRKFFQPSSDSLFFS